MITSFALNSFAQKSVKTRKNIPLNKDIVDNGVKQNLPIPIIDVNKSIDEDINRIFVGKGSNVRTVRREDNKGISYNSELGIISMVFLLDPGTYGGNPTDLGMVYSYDNGQTWSDVLKIVENGDDYINDYPSGIIYNPNGNNNVEDAYGVIQNISHQGNWNPQFKMWSSMTLGGENNTVEVKHEDSNDESGYWNQFGLSLAGDGVRCMGMWPDGPWGEYTAAALQPIYGEFNGSGFDWNDSQLVDMDLFLYIGGDLDGTICWTGRFQGYDGGIEMAWSDDGQIGYIWMIGSTADEPSGMQPIVYKTEDAGDTWDFVSLNLFEDNVQTMFADYMPQAEGGLIIPRVSESAGIVDYHGDLQMVIIADAYADDVISDPELLSAGVNVYNMPGDIYNMTINNDGVEQVIFIDSLYTDVITDDNADFSFNGVGWTHRLMIAKNDFENEYFVTWIDSRIMEEEAVNNEPDIFGWSRNIHTNLSSDPQCFTEGTLYEKFYYFTYGADRAIYNDESQTYTIPYMQAISPSEFSSSGATDPITINYITGIEFSALGEYVSVNNLKTESNILITQNNPNPFNGSTTINVTTETSAPVMVEVSNMMGQTIYTINGGTVNGTKEITLTSDNMEAGVYFYTVTVGNESITKKMIVK